VCQQDSASVRGFEAEGRFADAANDSHPGANTRFVPLVVAKTTNDFAIQFPQWRNRERRNQISGENDELTMGLIKDFYGPANVIKVVVAVCENTD